MISHFAARQRVSQPDSPVVVSDDFNKEGPELQRWTAGDSWSQPLDKLLSQNQKYNTYWARAVDKQSLDYHGTSRTDHLLLKDGSGITAPSFTLYTGSYWAFMSDHRPLLCRPTEPEFIQVEPSTQKLRAPPRVVRKHGLKQQGRKTVGQYISKLRELNTADGLTRTGTPPSTGSTMWTAGRLPWLP